MNIMKRLLPVGLLLAVTLTGCKGGQEEYIPGPSWELYNVLTSEYQGDGYKVNVPDWGEDGRSGDDYYVVHEDEDERKSILIVAKGEADADVPPAVNPDSSATRTSSIETLAPIQTAMYDLMGTRLDAVIFQVTGQRYVKGTYSIVEAMELNGVDGISFEGEYTVAVDDQGAEPEVFAGTGCCLDSDVGPVLVFGLDISEDPEEMDKLSQAVKDVGRSLQVSTGSGLVQNPISTDAGATE